MDPVVRVDAVSETLFLPLYALALDSQRSDPIVDDPAAVALARELNRSFADRTYDWTGSWSPVTCRQPW